MYILYHYDLSGEKSRLKFSIFYNDKAAQWDEKSIEMPLTSNGIKKNRSYAARQIFQNNQINIWSTHLLIYIRNKTLCNEL